MDDKLADKTVGKPRGRPFEKGNKANLKGRPKGVKNYTTLLAKALKKYEKETNKDLFKRFIERAFVNDKVLIAIMKKFVPDMEKSEISTDSEMVIINLVPVKTPQDVENLEGNNG